MLTFKIEAAEAEVIHVVHECFGKARASVYPRLYESPNSKCIRCKECSKWFLKIIFVICEF
jgi:hypothetical protein